MRDGGWMGDGRKERRLLPGLEKCLTSSMDHAITWQDLHEIRQNRCMRSMLLLHVCTNTGYTCLHKIVSKKGVATHTTDPEALTVVEASAFVKKDSSPKKRPVPLQKQK